MSFATVLAAESRAELLKALRLPAFILPTLLFPAMFYLIFGVFLAGSQPLAGVDVSAYMLASYGVFGVVGAALFGMGVGVAAERGQGWLLLKAATPMPPLAYFGAKLVMSVLIGALVALVLAILGATLGGVTLPAWRWVALFLVLTAGALPFCALGCTLGYLAGPSSAPAVANLIYLPMSLLSGLWLPIEMMPDIAQTLAPLMPPYHAARLAHGVVGVPVPFALHTLALLGFTALFLGTAAWAYRRDDGRTWG